MSDPINHPAHYTSSPAACPSCGRRIECIDVTEHMSFTIGNAVKYLWRAGLKGDALTDLRKALWYVERAIMQAERAAAGTETGLGATWTPVPPPSSDQVVKGPQNGDKVSQNEEGA